MKIGRIVLAAVGILAALLGLVWMGQGSGYFPYPAASIMINQSPWIWRGAILTIVGIVVFLASRRLR
jgi:hypothetical protein